MMLKKKKEELRIEEVNAVISLSKKILNILYVMLIVVIVFIATILVKELRIHSFLFNVFSLLSPLFIGFVIAWLFNPLVKRLQKYISNRVYSSLIVYFVFIIMIVVFLNFLVPTVYTQFNSLSASIPEVLEHSKNGIENFIDKIGGSKFIDIEKLENDLYSNIKNVTNDLPHIIYNGAFSLLGILGTIGLSLGFGLFMLFEIDEFSNNFLKMLPKKNKYEFSVLLKKIGFELRKCVNGTFIVSLVVFICSSIGFWTVGLSAPVLFGLFCGMMDVIPFIGPWIGGSAAVIVGFSQGFWVGVLVIVVIVVVQFIENMILQPLIMGKTTNLHPVVIMLGLLVFGHFFGIIGMILATPILSLTKVVLKYIILKFNLFEK